MNKYDFLNKKIKRKKSMNKEYNIKTKSKISKPSKLEFNSNFNIKNNNKLIKYVSFNSYNLIEEKNLDITTEYQSSKNLLNISFNNLNKLNHYSLTYNKNQLNYNYKNKEIKYTYLSKNKNNVYTYSSNQDKIENESIKKDNKVETKKNNYEINSNYMTRSRNNLKNVNLLNNWDSYYSKGSLSMSNANKIKSERYKSNYTFYNLYVKAQKVSNYINKLKSPSLNNDQQISKNLKLIEKKTFKSFIDAKIDKKDAVYKNSDKNNISSIIDVKTNDLSSNNSNKSNSINCIYEYQYKDINNKCCVYILDQKDLYKLNNKVFLNDQIINFYIQYCIDNSNDINQKIINFTSLFYTKITMFIKNNLNNDFTKFNYQSYKDSNIYKWKKTINKFDASLWTIPINEYLHWSGILIVNPSKIENMINDYIAEEQNNNLNILCNIETCTNLEANDNFNIKEKKNYIKNKEDKLYKSNSESLESKCNSLVVISNVSECCSNLKPSLNANFNRYSNCSSKLGKYNINSLNADNYISNYPLIVYLDSIYENNQIAIDITIKYLLYEYTNNSKKYSNLEIDKISYYIIDNIIVYYPNVSLFYI